MYKIRGADQKDYGPVSADQIRQWIAEGRANGQTLAQAEGSAEWKPLADFPEFSAALASLPPPPMAAPSPAATLPGGPRPHVPNYLVPAILCTLCCCLPFGVVAIIYAAQVNGKLEAGDLEGAMAYSRNAKLWCWLSFGAGLLIAIAYLVMWGAGFTTLQR